mgnify:CR=1 FL=1
MKELINEIKKINERLETLYATQYVLEEKGDKVDVIDKEIEELETRKASIEEIVYAASLVK